MPTSPKIYASIWRRIAAYLADYAILFTALISLQAVIFAVSNGFPYKLLKTGLQVELWIFLSISLPVWLYFAFSEQSFHQATIGKRLFRLQVANINSSKIGFGQALLRTVIKLTPWELTHLTLMLPVPLWWDPMPSLRPGIIIAYVLIGIYLVSMLLNSRKQSLHDIIARTVVVEILKDETPQ